MTSTQLPPLATGYPLSFQSTAASLPSFFARRPLFSIACSLFSENTRVGGTLTPPHQAALPKRAHFAKGCKNTETATLTTFRINTCKSVSKQRTLTIFRINTCEKQGGGGLELYTVSRPTSPACLESGLPIHTTLHRTALSGVLVKDELDRLPTPQPEISVQPEPAVRRIHDQTGNSRLVSFEVDDQAGALLRRNPPQVSWLARISCQRRGRRLACRTFLRRRIDLGVISTNSSSAMNSMACSRLSSRWGMRRMASSALEERMLVCFFSLVTLTSISCSREFSPRIMPS